MDDLVEGLIRLMNGNYSQPVNLGNPQEYTVKVRDVANEKEGDESGAWLSVGVLGVSVFVTVGLFSVNSLWEKCECSTRSR